MGTEVVIKPDGTTEITYNDNRKLKVAPGVDIGLTYPCPHAPSCKAFFYTQDDLNQHRIFEHGELPKNIFNTSAPQNQGKYFKRSSMYRLSGSIQRKNLEHALLVLGVDLQLTKRSILKRIREWLDSRRDKA